MKRAVLAPISIILLYGTNARAQAWVEEQNSLTVSLGYSFGTSDTLKESDGKELTNRNVTHHATVLDLSYATPLAGLAIDAELPLKLIKWQPEASNDPNQPEARGHGPDDDGSFHGTITDLRVGARYMVIDDPLALTFGAAGTIPTHSYTRHGLAAPGRDLLGLHLNAAIGATADPILPHLYGQAIYEFSLFQKLSIDGAPETSSVDQNRSELSFRIGYFILENLQAHLDLDFLISHGGINFVDFANLSQGLKDNHDALLKENIYTFGGGVGYGITEFLAIQAFVRIFIGGTNTQATNIFGGGLSWTVF